MQTGALLSPVNGTLIGLQAVRLGDGGVQRVRLRRLIWRWRLSVHGRGVAEPAPAIGSVRGEGTIADCENWVALLFMFIFTQTMRRTYCGIYLI